jgi:UDP-2-acetamido-2-deoxy-ribo-hexuluronate aminotransferase
MDKTKKRTIQFIDLGAQQARIRGQVEERIRKVLDHGRYIMGPEVKELEEKLAAYTGVKHCITCASGTDALLMPLMAYGVGPGDAILTPPFTFISTAEVAALLGATPIFVDIDPLTYNIDPEQLYKVMQSERVKNSGLKVKGIIPVDLFGQPADYDEIETFAKEYGMFVLEDAAQAFGAEYRGRKTCSFGDVAATSFFPAKPFGCYGDGGAIFTENDELAAKMRSIRVHGQGSDKYDNVRIGINGRFDTMQAAVLLAKLEIFEDELPLRNTVASRYSLRLSGKYTTPAVKEDRSSVWAQYCVLSENREGDLLRLKEWNIPTAIYYPKPLHLQDAYLYLGYQKGDFPVTEFCAERIFSVPMHPYMEQEEQAYIIEGLLG